MNATQILTELIKFDTTSKNSNLELISYLFKKLSKKASKIQKIENENGEKANLIIHFGPLINGGLLLSAHTDVVPVSEGEWNSHPFKLTRSTYENKEILIGRGTADMKTFIAQMIVIGNSLDGITLKKPLIFSFSYDEEVGCIGARSIAKYFEDNLKPDYAIIGEPTNFNIGIAHKGHVQIEIEIEGIEAHASKINDGVNAISYAGKIINFLNNLADDLKQDVRLETHFNDYPFNTINIGRITGGKAINIIPSNCLIELGYRTLPGDNSDDIFHKIKNHIKDHISPKIKSENKNANIIVRKKVDVPPMLTPEKTPLETLLKDITSQKSTISLPYTTEGGIFSNVGITSIIFGPGDINNAHKSNEFIFESELHQGINYIMTLIKRLLT